MDYWQQLKYLKIYSLQRRRERYVIIYFWKTLEEMVPNFGIKQMCNGRHGRYCLVPHVKTTAPVRVQNIRFSSLSVNGPRLFNILPHNIRNMTGCSIDSFKKALDKHLQAVPDEPRVKKMIQFCSKSSNSLLEMKSQ